MEIMISRFYLQWEWVCDGDNDIEILSTVGMGMAMANGSVKARNSAKIVVPSVFGDFIYSGNGYGNGKWQCKS